MMKIPKFLYCFVLLTEYIILMLRWNNKCLRIANKIIETGILNNSKRILKSVKKVAYVTREENVLE